MTGEEHYKNFISKIYRVEVNLPYFGDQYTRWTGYRKGRQALDAIRDIRREMPKWKFRIKIVHY